MSKISDIFQSVVILFCVGEAVLYLSYAEAFLYPIKSGLQYCRIKCNTL